MKIVKYFVLISLLAGGTDLLAQDKEFNLWSSVSVEAEPIKNFEINLDFENRFKENLQIRDETFSELSLKYSLKAFSFGLSYRFSNINKNNPDYIYANRFSYELEYKHKIRRFELALRSKYQNHFESLLNSETGKIPENYLRSRIKLDYNIKGIPLDPFISFENFLRLNQDELRQIEKHRLSIGANYKLSKNHRFGVFLHYQPERNVSKPDKDYIIGIKYKFKL